MLMCWGGTSLSVGRCLGEEQHHSVLPASLRQSGLVLWHSCVLPDCPGSLTVSMCSGTSLPRVAEPCE